MDDDSELIREYVANALPQGTVSDLVLRNGGSSRTCLDGTGNVSFAGDRGFSACFEIKKSTSLASLKDIIALSNLSDLPGARILLAPYLSERKQEMLRKGGVGFIDGAGNAWIDTENILVDRRGNKAKSPSAEKGVASIFSDKATLVPRLLFPGGVMGVREMSLLLGSQGFGLTPGYVSKVVTSLVEERYARRSSEGVGLVNRRLLLEEWAVAYRRKAARIEKEGWYCPLPNIEELARKVGSSMRGRGALTDRAGASFVSPYAAFDSVDVMARDERGAREALRELGAKPVERGANINLIKPCYPVSAFYGSREVEGICIASDLQLYLDLGIQQKRGVEAAEHIFKRRILPMIEGGAAQ